MLVLFLLLILLFAGYFFLAFYYRDGFCLNTWINGVYCTGKTVEEVNEELLSRMEAPVVMVTDRKGESFSLNLEEMGYEGDYLPSLNRYMKEQNAFLWVDNILFHRNHELAPASVYDEDKLREAFQSSEPVLKETQRPTEYLLARNWKDGYILYDGLSGRLDEEKAFRALKEAVDKGNYTLDLKEADCYYDIPLTEEQQEIRALWEKVQVFQKCNLIYDMGDCRIPLDSFDMSGFLKAENGIPVTDQDGNLMLDETGVAEFIASLANTYDTYGVERTFQSTRGDLITVKGGTYGTKLDRRAEVAFLMETLLLEKVHEENTADWIHIPVYEKETPVRGQNDIGNTYIEIDMTDQKLYYYADGALKLETEVVTGNTGRKMGTPEGVNFVYNKEKNRVLRGPGYASFVKFWMPVKGNIGIHDANWRSKFGGTIYQTNGSHGCINTPTEKMTELYDMVEIGTPVVMFY